MTGILSVFDYTVISEQIKIVHVYKGKGVRMKKVLPSVFVLIVLLAACAPQAAATQPPVNMTEEPMQGSGDLTSAQDAAVSTLAKNLGLETSEIEVVSTESVEWPDACLGVTQEDIACAQVVTPGYKIILEANGKQVEYHTNEDGTVVVPATMVLTWSRSGGIAGFCDSITIYLSGEVQAGNCKGTAAAQKSVNELLSPEEIATMNEWISKYGEINIDASDPKGVADGMSVKLTMYGTGTEQTIDPASQQQLFTFVQDLYQATMGQ
jgi:hypothetical protein